MSWRLCGRYADFFFEDYAFFAVNSPFPKHIQMRAQIIALTTAIVYAMSFILSKRGMRYSTPLAITAV